MHGGPRVEGVMEALAPSGLKKWVLRGLFRSYPLGGFGAFCPPRSNLIYSRATNYELVGNLMVEIRSFHSQYLIHGLNYN